MNETEKRDFVAKLMWELKDINQNLQGLQSAIREVKEEVKALKKR
jgi:predicted  nucleic acid-binding Zn-ribbon protein